MKKQIIDFIKKYLLMIILPVALYVFMTVVASDFVSFKNVPSLLKQAIAPAILGWGVLFNIKVGNWDFSVGSSVLISAIIGGNIAINLNLGIFGLIVFSIIIGTLAGALVGLVYKLLKIPTIIVSIGILLIYESLGSYVFGGTGVFLPSNWNLFSSFHVYGIGIIVALFAYFLYYKTQVGYNVRAVGNNPSVANVNGLNVINVKMKALIIAGLFAGIYALISLGTSGVQKTVSSMGTMGVVFDAMMCVFIGMSISLGGNLIVSIYSGSLIVQLIKLALLVLGFPSEYNSIVIAIFVIIFMVLSSRSDIYNFQNLKRLFKKKSTVIE